MKLSLLVFVSAIARVTVSQGINSSVAQQQNASGQVSQQLHSLMPDGVTTLPPACALKCYMQSAPVAPVTSSFDPIQALCSKHVSPDPAVADQLKACLWNSCTVLELLQGKRYTAELCHEPKSDLGPTILAVIWVTESISIIAIFLRVLARTSVLESSKFEENRWGWDDTTITVALVANLSAGVVVTLAITKGGYGQNVWMLKPNQITYGIKHLIISEPIYLFSLGIVKVAILLFYLRIFPSKSGHRRFRIFCWVLIAAISVYTVVHMLILIFQCWPVSHAWNQFTGHSQGTCWDYRPSVLSHGILNMASDWIVFVMPIKNLLDLKMKKAKKGLVIAVLAFGLGGSVCSIFRLVELNHARRADFKTDPNVALRFAKFLMWSTAEANATLFCACMPMAVQVVRRITGKVHASYPRSQKLGQKISEYSSSYGHTDGSTQHTTTITTKASRRGHLSMELTNISEIALGGARDEEKGGSSHRCGSSLSGSWNSGPGTAV
ncbi:CFEM domain protein [Apiospora arundinis]|uniref:CFEM domain protein n=1 Tax=Apiospora arundinis TaxID=335852 RepID=A0ABR2HNJ5_9PEZI